MRTGRPTREGITQQCEECGMFHPMVLELSFEDQSSYRWQFIPFLPISTCKINMTVYLPVIR